MLLSVVVLSGCAWFSNDHPCGDGTVWDGEACVVADDSAAEDSEADADTDSDSDTDTDADTDSDSDADADWTVCDDGVAPYTTIQDAIDNAGRGDMITVCAGTWDPFELEYADLTITGEDAETTVIVGASGSPAVNVFESDLDLSGVTIVGFGGSVGGMALTSLDSDLRLHDMRFAEGAAFGILNMSGGASFFEDIAFEDNEISGEGIIFSSTTVRHCIFRDNTGGGTFIEVYTDSTFENNLVYGNHFSSTTVRLLHVLGRAYNNVVYDNSMSGAGSYLLYSVYALRNNIVTSNEGDVSVDPMYSDYNIYYDNAGTILGEGSHDLDANPDMVDPESGDFTLSGAYSPAIDGGDPNSAFNDADGSRNDIGAFGGPYGEWDPTW